MGTWEIRRVRRGEAEQLRALKIEAATAHPTQFAFSPEDMAAATVEEVAAGLDDGEPVDATFGVYVDGRLCGTGEFARGRKSKARHRGEMKAVYVQPTLRGSGVADELMRVLLGHAAKHVDAIYAAVGVDNVRAKNLYFRHGFRSYGIEPGMIRYAGEDVPGEMLLRHLRVSGAAAACHP